MAFGSYKDIPLADLVPYERNARTHSDLQVSQLARSMNEFGFTNPGYVDVIIGRWEQFTGRTAELIS